VGYLQKKERKSDFTPANAFNENAMALALMLLFQLWTFSN